ncbi:beta-galactosidase [Russula earlei]|uniref:Beta-galactosidase n=1 Tax=Russula earlei TaxID=71964 RepID=A0ACC0U731_9AGAM|nr:beta-galactosidase [Russula earlei]
MTRIIKRGFLLLATIISVITLTAQGRIQQCINTNWQFHKGDIAGYPDKETSATTWEKTSLPHTWNTTDVLDDEPGYYRGIGWYRKTIFIPSAWNHKEIYLHFGAAQQVATVYVNGKLAGTHTGGYTAFNCRITDLLIHGNDSVTANEISVKVDNSHNENIPPLSADFTFFGGIYRDVSLVALNPVHFDAENDASNGVFITTPQVSAVNATVDIKGQFCNQSSQARRLLLVSRIADRAGKLVGEQQQHITLQAGERYPFTTQFAAIQNPHLWNIEDPYLYHVTTTVTDADNQQLLDEVSNPLGLRWFSFDAAQGFFLNGKHYKLMGASRHQDYKDISNALPDAMHVRDVQLLKEMGGNFLRVAHYPQDPAVLEACDRLGIVASVEIPVVNRITENDTFANNCLHMQEEMIRQYCNHPSIVIWAYMNEVLLSPRYNATDTVRRTLYYQHVAALAKRIDSLTRKEDPSRYTMIPCHADYNVYVKAGLVRIPQIVGWNLYSGWYSGELPDFARTLDRHHKELTDKPLIVTEYGADADIRLHNLTTPQRFDKTVEYATHFHDVYYEAIASRPFVTGGALWNLADFNSEGRAEANPHINTKGITTIDRKLKDSYLFYQSKLVTTPFLRIGSRAWVLRSGIAEDSATLTCTQSVDIYTNQGTPVILLLNGVSLGTVTPVNGVAGFKVPFRDGINQLEAVASSNGKTYKDMVEVRFLLQPANLASTVLPFKELNISLGDQRQFSDEPLQQVWLPEQPYHPGSWGYVGGQPFVMKGNKRQSYGSDKNILGTDYDAIYETQRVGIRQFKLDVPDGDYEITLLFAELLSAVKHEALVYNLDNNKTKEDTITRSFDVLINGEPFINHLGSDNYLQPEQAYSAKTKWHAGNGQGITISFNAIKGETILNGLQVRRVD